MKVISFPSVCYHAMKTRHYFRRETAGNKNDRETEEEDINNF